MKAVIFDVDGTLIDSVEMIWEKHKKIAGLLGLKVPSKRGFLSKVGKPWETIIRELWPGIKPHEFMDFYRENVSYLLIPAVDGTSETLQSLKKNYRIAIMTSKDSQTLFRHLLDAGIDKSVFDIIHHENSLRNHKPHPDALFQVCEELGIKPQEAVYVGDSVIDAQCAISAGVNFIGVLTGAADKEDFEKLGVKSVGSIKDVPGFIRIRKAYLSNRTQFH
ncbi:MAG: hypothetical protein MSIBF_00590 [Candidatus Altiarchaeales archaeon IMC4]|nr:MAG: hypothetical protein MSIBF_00590 [Candidatus Altiarchaeales archaeon IMC4]